MMNKYTIAALLAAAVTTSYTFAESQPMEPNTAASANVPAQNINEPTGVPIDAMATAGARQRLASVVNSAVSPNGYNDLVGSLSKEDRERLAAAKTDTKQLNDEISRLRTAYREKYGRDLAIDEDHFRDLIFVQGQDKQHAYVTVRSDTAGLSVQGSPRGDERKMDQVVVSERKADGTIVHEQRTESSRVMNPDLVKKDNETPAQRDARVASEGQRIRADGQPDKSQYEAKVNPNGQPGQQGVVTSDPSTMMPARLTLVREDMQLNPWRVDAPDSLNSQSLERNLARELSSLNSSQAAWPEDANKAQRLIAIHVFNAVQNSGATLSSE